METETVLAIETMPVLAVIAALVLGFVLACLVIWWDGGDKSLDEDE